MGDYRGRLLFPVTAEIARLDLASSAADPDGAGPLTTGIDPDYREPIVVASPDRLGRSVRQETTVQLPAQVDTKFADKLQMLSTGDSKQTIVVLVFHFSDLEALGLVDPTTGKALIKTSDRLNALYRGNGTLIQAYSSPQIFAQEATPIGIGIGGDRNLLRVVFQSTDMGV